MILSSPRGSDPEKVLAAAREWASKELAGRRYLLALHTDTPNPHVHITYANSDKSGQRSYPNREVLQERREAWARELGAVGIEVIATPRQARGVVAEKESTAQRRQNERGDAPERAASKYLKYMTAQREKVIDVFKSAIADLGQSKEADAPEIARSLSTFVQGLEQDAARDRGEPARAAPPDRVLPTEGEQILDEMRAERSHREQYLARDADAAGQSPPERSPEREVSDAPEPDAPDRAGAETAPPDRQVSRSGAPQHGEGARPDRDEQHSVEPEIVELGGEKLDLTQYDPDTAKMLREYAEEERERNTIELGGETFDLRRFDPEAAKILRESADEERERNTLELGGEKLDLRRYDPETVKILKEAARAEREHSNRTKEASQVEADRTPEQSQTPAAAQQRRNPDLDKIVEAMAERQRERARDKDRGGPSR